MTKKKDDNQRTIKKELDKFQRENEQLKRQIEKLKKEKEAIKKEYEDYKLRHPETVGVKNKKPYFIKAKTKASSSKRPGARKGHKPHFRKPPENIDQIEYLFLDICPICGGTSLSENVQEERTRCIEDIPVVKPVVIQYRVERRYCRDCKKIVEMPIENALPKAKFGLRTMLIVMYLKIGLRLPAESIVQMLQSIFNMTISRSGVHHILQQLGKEFGPFYDNMVKDMRNASARHMDETTWRINGENVYLWAFITKYEAVYKIARSRSHKVPLEVLGKNHSGVDIHDRFSAYKTLAKKTGNPQQDCWSHIIVNAEELSRFRPDDGKYILEVLKDIFKRAKSFEHKGNDEDIESLFDEMVCRLDIPYESLKCHKFVVNLLKEK
ncbi:MAG: IS66 family transposase, partial [Candidatus Gerdarchaeota archaeon]